MNELCYRSTGASGRDVVERLSTRTDGAGWACTAVREDAATGAVLRRLDLRVDGAGVTTRLHAEAGGWVVRGGCVGTAVLWRRGEHEGEAEAVAFTGSSPAHVMAVAARLALEVGDGRRVRLVELSDPVLAPRLVVQSWTRTAPDRWVADDLDTGERRMVELREGVVVAAPGLTLTRP